MAREFSLWWSGGADDAIFWRTSQSGGRATQRRKKGKATFGQQGDLQATNPIGAPLTRLCTIEVKRGYKDAHLGDLLDLDPEITYKERPLAGFIEQAKRESASEGTPYWLLVVRRDRRAAMVYMHIGLREAFRSAGAGLWLRDGIMWTQGGIYATALSKFFGTVHPDQVRRALAAQEEV